MATDAIMDSYYGHTAISGLLANWLQGLKASSASSDDTVQKNDASSIASNEVRDIVQDVLYSAAKEKFTKSKGDEMTNMSRSEIWFIEGMIQSPRWRKLLIDLATTNKDSVLLKYCVRRISDLGYHRELAKRINMTDDFSVYNSTLKAEFGNLISSIANDSGSSMDLNEIVEDIKRMCTSASFTYLYAVEVSQTQSIERIDGTHLLAVCFSLHSSFFEPSWRKHNKKSRLEKIFSYREQSVNGDVSLKNSKKKCLQVSRVPHQCFGSVALTLPSP